MNIELRKDVLERSLIVENALSRILSLLFRFPKDGSKTLGHTSNSLSFKTKADLLFDLKRLDDREYKELIMFMEIRNQLIHNLDTDTLSKAINRCNKTNKFLDLNPNLKKQYTEPLHEYQKETILKFLFEELIQRLLSTCKKIVDGIENEIKLEELRKAKELESELLSKALKILGHSIDKISDVYDEVLVGNDTNNQKHKGKIRNFINSYFLKELKLEYPDLMNDRVADINAPNE